VDKTTRWEGCSCLEIWDEILLKEKGSCVLEVAWDWDNELGWIGLDWIGLERSLISLLDVREEKGS
jgi:hypothetical protein